MSSLNGEYGLYSGIMARGQGTPNPACVLDGLFDALVSSMVEEESHALTIRLAQISDQM